MSYYKTNAVYDQLISRGHHSFRWLSGNAWALLYGDATGTPRVAVLAHGRSWQPDLACVSTVGRLFTKLKLPCLDILFDDSAADIAEVTLASQIGGSGTVTSLSELRDIFARHGLPVATTSIHKAVNDATSSAFHQWQRSSLGASIRVTDIDLLRVDGAGEVLEVLELKRSYLALTQWMPFAQDFPNFNLLLAALTPIGVPLTIAYNVRHKQPRFLDDPSSIKVFKYANPGRPEVLGIVSFDDFVLGQYGKVK